MMMSSKYQGNYTKATAADELEVWLKICFKEQNKGNNPVHFGRSRLNCLHVHTIYRIPICLQVGTQKGVRLFHIVKHGKIFPIFTE